MDHGSIDITIDRYGHLFPDEQDRLADALDAMYEQGRHQLDAEVFPIPTPADGSSRARSARASSLFDAWYGGLLHLVQHVGYETVQAHRPPVPDAGAARTPLDLSLADAKFPTCLSVLSRTYSTMPLLPRDIDTSFASMVTFMLGSLRVGVSHLPLADQLSNPLQHGPGLSARSFA